MSRFADLHFPGAPHMVVEPPGPKAAALLSLQEKYESAAVLYPKSLPLALAEGKGSTVKDVDGNLYLDFYAGISVLNFGHANPVILKAAEAQLRRLTHSLDFPHETRLELIRTLIETAPGRLRNDSRVLFGGPTGADAVESALKLARHHRNRYAVISFEGAYHGQTAGTLAVGSQTRPKTNLPPLVAETHFLPYPYCYRCPFGKGADGGKGCCMEPERNLERILSDPYSGVPEPAAVILEPVQGEGGIVDAPLDFLREVRRITEERGIPLIVDEIQAGLGRTGDMYSCEAAGITPDLMPIAKSIGGGLPLSALVVRPDLDAWEPGAHVGTFRGNLVGMAAGLAALQFMDREKLLDYVKEIGGLLKRRLSELAEEYDFVGDVRGRGLMLGMELVKDRQSKEPWKDGTRDLQMACLRRGLIVWKAGRFGNVLRLLPPLVTTKEQIEKGADLLGEATATLHP
jgi:diaminobutyrate-2-oxoglutarate transaminase